MVIIGSDQPVNKRRKAPAMLARTELIWEGKYWSQWIDYWAVDWDNKDDTFHNQWQTFRTRKDNKLTLSAEYKYTTKMVKVRVK